jgi:glycosyltransferase involved in cell wall biosynthesis
MRALFATADLVLLPSVWYENASQTLAESLTAGTPVAGADIGGIPEFIEHGTTGYLFPPGDATALADCVIGHLSRTAAERRAMRRRCAELAQRALSIDLHLDMIEQVYGEVLG